MSIVERFSPRNIYIIAVSTLIVLIVSNQLLIQKILDEKKDDATVINLAGRQRMLSQKIAKTVYLAENSDIQLQTLKTDIQLWSNTHEALKNGSEELGVESNENELIQTLFSEIEPHFEGINTSLLGFNTQEEVVNAIPFVQRHEMPFLTKMDEIVNTFETISNESVRRLIRLEVILGLFSLFILGGEIYLVFRIFLAQIKSKNEELENTVQELSDSKGELFEYVQRFELSLKAINAGIWDWYLEDNSEWWSPRFYEMLGYQDGEIEPSYNTFLNTLLHRDDKEMVVSAVENHLKNSVPYKLEIRMKDKSGEYHWFETVGQASFDTDGNPIRMVGSIIDIDERKKIASELVHAEDVLEISEKIGGVVSWVFDFEKNEEIYGQNMLDLYGFNVKPVRITDAILGIVHKDDFEKVKKAFYRSNKKEEPWKIEYRIESSSGKLKHILAIVSEIKKNNEGRIVKIIGTTQDVTESRKNEAELNKRKQQLERSLNTLQEIQEVSKIGTWEVDLSTMTAYWSDEVYRIHELKIGTQIKVEEGINFYREDYRPVIQSAIDKAIAENKSWDKECILVTNKGKQIWVRAIGYPVFEGNELVRLRGLFMNIDESKRKSIELDEANEKLQLSVEAGQIAIWIWDLETNELEWNDQAYDVFGVSKDYEPTFEKFSAMIHPDDLEHVVEATENSIKSGERFDIQFRFNKGDGNEIILSGRGDIVRDEDGNPVQMIGINMDITDRNEMVENLKRQESQLRSFVEQAPAAVAMFDKDMKYITVSNKWYEHNKIEDEDILGRSHYEVLPQVAKRKDWIAIHKRVLAGEELSNDRDRFIRKDGAEIWISWTAIPWHNTEGEIGGMILYVSDISKEVEYTEELENEIEARTQQIRKQAENLEQMNKELESFSYSISHDLRAPLRSINGFSDIILEDHSDQLDKEGKRLMGVVKQSAVTMGQLIDDILEFSRLGKKKIQKTEIDMAKLFESICEAESNTYSEKNVDVKIDNLPKAMGDLALIKQVVVNLVSNAFKYSSKQEKISITIGYQESDEHGDTYFIKDNGTGFKMEYHDKLFGVFHRLHSKKEFEGTGVGLAIVKRIINKHGGEIWAKSEEGEGSIFFFSLQTS